MKTFRLLLAAAFALASLASAHALDRVLGSPRIKDNGDIDLSDDVKIGKWNGSKIDVKDDLLVGSAALGSALASSVLTRLSAAQIADVRSGAGMIDLSPTLNAALNNCSPTGIPPTITFPAGTYGIASELLIQTCKVNIVLEAGATIRQIAGFAPGIQLRALIHFQTAAAGSTLTGAGTIDGNRANLINAYLALPKSVQSNGLYVMTSTWDGVLVEATSDVMVSGVTIRNIMNSAVQHAAGNGSRFFDLRILDATVATVGNANIGDTWHNITEENIGNVVNTIAIPCFQYSNVFFDQVNLKYNNVSISGVLTLVKDGTSASPGARIGDPNGGAFFFQRLNNSRVSGLLASNFSYADGRSAPAIWGLLCDNCVATVVSDLTLSGPTWGAEFFAPQNVTLNGFALDGQNNMVSAAGYDTSRGLSVKPSAQLRGNSSLNGDSSFDHYNNMPAMGLSISNGVVRRFNDGVTFMTGNTTISNVRSSGNLSAGFLFWANRKGASYPGGSFLPVSDISGSNLIASYNGGAGFQFNDGTNMRFSGVTSKNNGQNFATTNNAQGILINAGFGGPKKKIFFSGWEAEDDQSTAITTAASFVPGTVAGGTYQFVAANSSRLHIQQSIVVVNGGGSGKNITGQIADITNDFVTLKIAGSPTFTDTACRTALPGTVTGSAGSNLLTGTGTAFSSAILGPVYLRAGGQYLKVGAVLDDTHLQMDTSIRAALSGATIQIVQCALQGIPTQQTGFSAGADANIADISLGNPADYRAAGNTVTQINLAAASQFNDWSAYTPRFTTSSGSGVTFNGGANYKSDGKTLCVRSFVQVNYSTMPTTVSFTLPGGITLNGGASITGFNGNTFTPLYATGNSASTMTIGATTGSLLGKSGQFLQMSGCVQVQ